VALAGIASEHADPAARGAQSVDRARITEFAHARAARLEGRGYAVK
jgi:hypothetical protein